MSAPKDLSRDDILGHVDTRFAPVDVPEMGGRLYVAHMTVEEADRIRTLGDDGVPGSVRITILAACDKNGARLFTDADAPALKKVVASAIGKIANKALEHNGLTNKAQEEAKNASGETETDASDSASPSPSAEPSES